MTEIIAFLKGVGWLFVFALVPVAGWIAKKFFSDQDKRFVNVGTELGVALDKIDRQKDKTIELSERLVKLEANSVTKTELIELLRKLEDSIEARFDRSFNKLEASLNKLLEKN